MVDYDTSFDRLIGNEGRYVNNPADPGGETNWGITWPVLRQAIGQNLVPSDTTIAGLTRDQAKIIYKAFFWDIIGDSVAPAVKYEVFDFAVNAGISTAIRKLQDAVNVADDGHWGPVSVQAATAMDENDVMFRFNARKIRFYTKLTTFYPRYSGDLLKDGFGKGWMNRIADVLEYAATDN